MPFAIKGRLTPYSERVRSSLTEINTFYEENVSGVDLIKAYGQQEPRLATFERVSEEFCRESMKGTRLFAIFPTLQSVLMSAGMAGLLLLGLWQLRTGAVDAPTLLLAFLYLGALYGG